MSDWVEGRPDGGAVGTPGIGRRTPGPFGFRTAEKEAKLMDEGCSMTPILLRLPTGISCAFHDRSLLLCIVKSDSALEFAIMPRPVACAVSTILKVRVTSVWWEADKSNPAGVPAPPLFTDPPARIIRTKPAPGLLIMRVYALLSREEFQLDAIEISGW